MSRIIAIANQKGGVAKTTTCVNLGIGLAGAGKRVLLIDADAQGSLTQSLGVPAPDGLDTTLVNLMTSIINEEEPDFACGILRHAEGVDFIPANIELSGLENSLVNVIGRESILLSLIDMVIDSYDYVLIDCMPSLGMLTINALAAADSVIIPVEAAYLPVKGLEQLIRTIGYVHRKLNQRLVIDGILITKMDSRTNYARAIRQRIEEAYGSAICVYPQCIPLSVKAAEASAEGVSIYRHDPRGKVAEAYRKLTESVLADEADGEGGMRA